MRNHYKSQFCFTLLLSLLAFSVYSQENLSEALVAHYPFDLDVLDYSGNCLHGQNYGSEFTQNRQGIDGKAIKFDGITDFIEVAHSSLLNFSNEEDFAISLWIKVENGQSDLDTTDNDILSKWVIDDASTDHLQSGYPYTLRVINKKNNKRNYFYWAQFGGYTKQCKSEVDPHSKSSINNSDFFHICLNVRSNRFYFYVNGVLERMEGSSVMCDPSNVAPLRIGKRGGPNHANHFNGVIDDLTIWSRSLSEKEIAQISSLDFDLKEYLVNLTKKETAVKSDTLFFETDAWQLNELQKKVIEGYLAFLDLDKQYKLIIEGHTNNLCEVSYCEELSIRRANIVSQYLENLGYKCDGISSIGHGSQRQIASNKYPNSRKKNQRVEICLYKVKSN